MGLFRKSKLVNPKPYFESAENFIKKSGMIDKDNHNILLSKNVRISAIDRHIREYRNIAVLGQHATGKTTGYAEKNILMGDGNYVITSNCGYLYNRVKDNESLKEKGYRLKLFSPIREDSLWYNPLKYAKDNNNCIDVICTELLNSRGNDIRDEIFFKQKRMLLWAVLSYVTNYSENNNFKEVYKIFCDKDYRNSIFGEKFDEEEWKKNGSIEEIRLFHSSMILPQKTLDGCMLDICIALTPFISDKYTKDELDLINGLNKEKMMLFIDPYFDNPAFSPIIKILLYQIFDSIYKYREEKMTYENDDWTRPVIKCIFDDFQYLPLPEIFVTVLCTCTKFGVSVSILFQNIEQIIGKYGEKGQIMLCNIGTFIFLYPADEETAEWESKMLGSTTTTVSIKTGMHGTETSKLIKEERLMSVEELKAINFDYCIIHMHNRPYIIDESVRFYE